MISATAKAKIYIGTAHAIEDAEQALEAYEADTYTEIKEVENLGEWGADGKELTFINLGDSHVRRRKGSIDSGSVALVVGRDPLDPGQSKARAATEEWLPYNFKVVLNDKPMLTGTPTTFYFSAVVLSAKNNFGTADDITKTTFTLGIDRAVIEVPADVVIVFSPLAGALPGATEDTPYTTTIAATGGVGTPSYAITTGTLPTGLTLNSTTGVINGTPTVAGTSNFTITATFSGGGTDEAAYSIIVT